MILFIVFLNIISGTTKVTLIKLLRTVISNWKRTRMSFNKVIEL